MKRIAGAFICLWGIIAWNINSVQSDVTEILLDTNELIIEKIPQRICRAGRIITKL